MPRRKTIEDADRPAPRDRTISIPVDDETYKASMKKAKGDRPRLLAVIRALLVLWSSDELPIDPPEELIEQQSRRAKKRPSDD